MHHELSHSVETPSNFITHSGSPGNSMSDYTPDAKTQEFLQQFTVPDLEKQGE